MHRVQPQQVQQPSVLWKAPERPARSSPGTAQDLTHQVPCKDPDQNAAGSREDPSVRVYSLAAAVALRGEGLGGCCGR